jgi:quercetin dioxygenase-like cupin family protein
MAAFRALACGMVIATCGLVFAQTKQDPVPGPVVRTLSSVDVREEVSGKPAKATTLEVTFEPGAAGKPHRHPGPTFGYILEGELDFQSGDEPVRRLKVGDTFYEPAMSLHSVSRNPSDKARTRVLAVMLPPRDATAMVIPEPAKDGK